MIFESEKKIKNTDHWDEIYWKLIIHSYYLIYLIKLFKSKLFLLIFIIVYYNNLLIMNNQHI